MHAGEWSNFGGDLGNTKYAALDQINAQNFGNLKVAWTWEPLIQKSITDAHPDVKPGQFKPTPLVVDGVMYLATSLSQVVAIDAATGNTLWEYDPASYQAGRPANVGFQHRGVAHWSSGDERRIFIATHDRKLIALNARTGATYPDFGENGIVDLETSLGRKTNFREITHSSPPGICRDTVIVGSIVFDGASRQAAPPGHVRGFDARTGKMKWIFHTIPQAGEPGVETWENDSWQYTGACNVWSMFAADEELGYVYLPTSTPTNDMYGGHRLGDNLFAECLVCLDADTGKRVWHFQAVHHGLWDYDFPTAPNLVDVVVDGKPVKAVAQVSK
jgi:quinoprotein glucose dehydrogenase